MSTPGLCQRSDGRWCGTLQVNGVRRFVYGKSEAEAKRKLLELQRQADVGSLADPGKRTVDDLLDEWLQTVRPTLKPRTLADYENTCRRYVRPAIGKVKLSKFNPTQVQRLYSSLQAKGLHRAPAQVHATLHRAFRLAVLWRWLGENPCYRVLPPRYAAARKDVWDRAQLRTFLDGIADRTLQPFWTVAVLSGCRLGELLGLRWEDIDLTTSAIRVRVNLQRIGREWVESAPKTKAGERTITLPPEGAAALKHQRALQAEWRLRAGTDWQETGLVFTGLKGQPLHHATASNALSTECRRLGLPKVTPHGLRHLHASILLDAGLPVPVVSARLGHAKPSITMSIYAHKVGRDDRQAVEALERVLAG